jgi:hypothetical protein
MDLEIRALNRPSIPETEVGPMGVLDSTYQLREHMQ